LDRILRTLIWKVGLEGLQKPSKALTRRIEEGWKRFIWDVDVRAAQSSLERLAGLPPVQKLLDSIPFELPDRRQSKPVLSRIRLRVEYGAALRQARVVFQSTRRPRSGPRIDTPTAALALAFPDVPPTRWPECKTASDAAVEVVKYRRADHLVSATVRHLVNSKPKTSQAALEHERRAADLDDTDLTTAIRLALATPILGALNKQ
jgi:hypothetical protein